MSYYHLNYWYINLHFSRKIKESWIKECVFYKVRYRNQLCKYFELKKFNIKNAPSPLKNELFFIMNNLYSISSLYMFFFPEKYIKNKLLNIYFYNYSLLLHLLQNLCIYLNLKINNISSFFFEKFQTTLSNNDR